MYRYRGVLYMPSQLYYVDDAYIKFSEVYNSKLVLLLSVTGLRS